MTTALDVTPSAENGTDLATAVVFPGQGSQRAAMAAAWVDHPAFARWTEADEALRRDVTRLGVDADADELRSPASCQVALFVHHAVLFDAWRRAGGTAAVVAGHSLGEYSALYAAGVLSFDAALRLVDVRARATEDAARANPGGMIACLGCSPDDIAQACRRAGTHMANDNAPGQIAVAGSGVGLDRFTQEMASRPGRTVRLDVGAAYHSPAMAPAVDVLGAALDAAAFADGKVPVVGNVDARVHHRAADWPALLRRQLTSPVRWRETMITLRAMGVEGVVELGASPVLTGLAKRTDPSLQRSFIGTPHDLGTPA